jgi:hypothetical protein
MYFYIFHYSLGNILFGMQCMNSEHPPVRHLLAALYENITRDKSNLKLKAQEIRLL